MHGRPIDRAHCLGMDAADPLARFRDRFSASKENRIFLDANSMSKMPAVVPERLNHFFTEQWVELGRQGWNHFDWLERPAQIGAAIAPLIGAAPADVLACDSTTVNLFKLLSYAWRTRASGSVILTEQGNFPTDLYVAQGLPGVLKGDPEFRMCESRAELVEAIGPDTAVVYLSHADYRTSERWDMADINARAHAAGAVTLWDLSHSAGAIPVDVMGSDADYAVGCGYKYLCTGPGGPAYLWVHPRHGDLAWPTISGWMGHEDVFAFAKHYAPLPGAARHGAGTPMVIANEVAWCAAEIWQEVDPPELWAKHKALGDLMIALLEQECGPLGVEVNTPRDYDSRGGHIGFSHPGAGPVVEALLAADVVGSFRRPNAIRFGLGPLYLSYAEIWEAVARLKTILETESWRQPQFQAVSV